jgi:hypothetical protein
LSILVVCKANMLRKISAALLSSVFISEKVLHSTIGRGL